MDLPANWDEKSHRLWVESQKEEALRSLSEVIKECPSKSEKELEKQQAFYLGYSGEWGKAVSVLEAVCRAYTDDMEALFNLGICYSKSGNQKKAVEKLEEVLKRIPRFFMAWDGLAEAYTNLGLFSEAKEAGERSLALKDESAKSPFPGWSPPGVPASEYAGAGKKRNVLSFSLWGDRPRYLRGALHNVLVASEVYPGWVCRFYVDDSVPTEFRSALREAGAELVEERDPARLDNRHRLARRFWVANDPGVGYFLVRDCDAVINRREAEAVKAWMESGRWFHVMRDWWTHTDLVLAGMWGGVAGVLPDLEGLFEGYRCGKVETPNWDQWFLRDRVWGLIRGYCLVHDRFFRTPGSLPFPGAEPEGNTHVGENEYGARREAQRKLLAGWIERLDCLRQPAEGATAQAEKQSKLESTGKPTPKEKWNRVATCRYGTMIYNKNDTYIGRSLEKYGEFSQGEARLFRQVVKPGQVVVEVGANIGAHTVLLALLTGPRGRVHAFEPQRLVFQMLAGNMAINNLNNVFCYQKAVGKAQGNLLVPVLDCEREINWGGLGFGDWKQGEPVEVITLDSLKLQACHFLKIDVEGMELEVLQGATGLIERCRPAIYAENDRKEKSGELIRFLDLLGYDLYWHKPPLFSADNFRGNRENIFGDTVSINMLCVHRSHPSSITGLTKVSFPGKGS